MPWLWWPRPETPSTPAGERRRRCQSGGRADRRRRAQDTVRARLETWLEDGEALHAPGVLPFEVANVLARLVFDGLLEVTEVAGIWTDVAALGLILRPFDLERDCPEVAVMTARLRRRHATDAATSTWPGASGRRSGPSTAPWPAMRPASAFRSNSSLEARRIVEDVSPRSGQGGGPGIDVGRIGQDVDQVRNPRVEGPVQRGAELAVLGHGLPRPAERAHHVVVP